MLDSNVMFIYEHCPVLSGRMVSARRISFFWSDCLHFFSTSPAFIFNLRFAATWPVISWSGLYSRFPDAENHTLAAAGRNGFGINNNYRKAA